MQVIEGIEIPNHAIELEKINDLLETIKFKYKQHEVFKTLNDNEYETLYGETMRILYRLGELSTPAFEIADKLETSYYGMYKHSPQLAKKLWLLKYHEIHKSYNLYKNRCYTLLDQLDELYEEIYDCTPKIFVEDM